MYSFPPYVTEWFSNALSVEVNEHGVVPLRFTEEQLAHYDRSLRSLCPSGICLEVDTDADSLELEIKVFGNTRSFCWFDLFVDGVHVGSEGRDEFRTGELTVRFAIPGNGQRRVSLQLPHNVQLVIRKIEWTPGAEIVPVKFDDLPLLLCLGDSITQGMDARYPSSTYPALLSRLLGMRLINQAVGGYIFNADSLAPLPGLNPALITVAYGTNDWGKWSSPEELHSKATLFLERLQALFPDSRIVVLTPLWRIQEDRVMQTGTLEQVRQLLTAICRDKGITCLDGKQLLPHVERFFKDGVHPMDEGFARLALALSRLLTTGQ